MRIVSFNEFLNESKLNEELKNINDEIIDDEIIDDEDYDFEKPEFVSDDKFLTKVTRIVLRKLKKSFNFNWNVYPFILKINGNKCTMINTETTFLILFKDGIEKKIALFKENPINNNIKSDVVVSTRKLGFLAMIKNLVDLLKLDFGDDVVLEAKEIIPRTEPEIKPVGTKSTTASVSNLLDALCGPIGKSGSRIGGHADDKDINEYLKLFELYDNPEITHLMTDDEFDETNPLYEIQNALYRTRSGALNSVNGTQVTNLIHMILCGSTYNLKPDVAKLLPTVWFWQGGKSGRLATFVDTKTGLWRVEESSDVIDAEVNSLDRKMSKIQTLTSVLFNYVIEGGKNGTDSEVRRTIGQKRGLFITGTGGLGKSEGIRKAIAETGAKENIDYIKLTTAPTEQSIYKDLYRYNNMVILYDDTDEYFDDTNKVKLYKAACSQNEVDRRIDAPGVKGSAGSNNSTFYDVKGNTLTRRERYFLEVGTISNYEKKKWIEKKKSDLKREEEVLLKDDPSFTKSSEDEIYKRAVSEFEEYASEHQRAMVPNRFTFNGFFVFITNIPIERYKNLPSMKPHWGALSGRLKVIDISPRQRIIWEWIKSKIMKDAENTELEDEMRILPLHGKAGGSDLENVIAFVESLINGEMDTETITYGKLEFRTISNLRDYLSSDKNTEEDWKENLMEDMQMSSVREVS